MQEEAGNSEQVLYYCLLLHGSLSLHLGVLLKVLVMEFRLQSGKRLVIRHAKQLGDRFMNKIGFGEGI